MPPKEPPTSLNIIGPLYANAARYFVVCADLLGSTIESAAVQLTVLPKGD